MNVLLGNGQLPAQNRWGSMTETASAFSAAHMLFGVYDRNFLRCWPDRDAPPPEALDDDLELGPNEATDFQKHVSQKIHRVGTIVQSFERVTGMATVSFLAEGIDHLWLRLEHLDAVGETLGALRYPAKNPFFETVAKYSDLLTRPSECPNFVCLDRHVKFGATTQQYKVQNNIIILIL